MIKLTVPICESAFQSVTLYGTSKKIAFDKEIALYVIIIIMQRAQDFFSNIHKYV